MVPVIVAVLAGAGGALAGYLTRKAKESEAGAAPGAASRARPAPGRAGHARATGGSPAGQAPPGRTFLFRWLADFLGHLAGPPQPGPETPPPDVPPPAQPPQTMSLRLAGVFNLLDRPLFFAGFALLAWLIVDLVLAYTLPAGHYAAIARVAGPILVILGPAAVGYWTNWLAIKMLFRPRRPNAVWRGLIPARRQELTERIADTILHELISPQIVRDYLHRSGVVRELTERIVAASRGVVDNSDFRHELKLIVYERIREEVTSPQVRQWVHEYVQREFDAWVERNPLFRPLAGKIQPFFLPRLQKLAADLLPRQALKSTDLVFERLDEQLDRLPGWIGQQSERIEEAVQSGIEAALARVDIRSILLQQLARKDEASLEEMLTSNVAREIVFIQTSGGLLGMLVGLAILWPPLRGAIVVFGLALWWAYSRTVKRE